jgi:arylsulfatase A-like enzyme
MNAWRWLGLGGAAAGATWACAEVAWIVHQPHVPVAWLRLPSLLPPRSLAGFLGVALATYVGLGAGLGLLAGIPARFLGRLTTPLAAFAWGAAAAGGSLLVLGLLVWVNLLGTLPPGHPTMLALDALAAVLALALAALAGWALFRLAAGQWVALLAVGLLLPALLAGVAWLGHRSIEHAPIAPRGVPRANLPNVVLVTIDTLRADHIEPYGGRARTPLLQQLADEGVRFQTAISQVPHTTPSHISIFTSLYPFEHGARNGVPMRAATRSLPEALRRLGYHTAAFPAGYTVVSQVTGLGDVFDVYVDSLSPGLPFLGAESVEPLALYRLLARRGGNQIPAPVVNGRVRSWLAGKPPEPFFLWVHYFDAHGPFEPLPGYRDLYTRPEDDPLQESVALYDAEITYTDHQFAELFDDLREAGVLDETIVIVTSDHGQAFGEPHPVHEIGHGQTLYDSVLRVPLLWWSPGRIPAGRVVDQQVESIDIAPTLLDLLGEAPPPEFVGRSLAGLLRGTGEDVEERLAFSQTTSHTRVQWLSVRSPEWKLHVSPQGDEQLFQLRRDPDEIHNVLEREPEVAERYRRLLAERWTADPQTPESKLDGEARERLRALGYVVE